MFGCWFAGDVPMPDGSKRTLKDSVPFRNVYIHALIRDANREKMSKTKGNVVDPIEIVKQYGTDAVRFTLASMASPGTDIAFNVARTEGYRAFANKIWNAARFLFMNVDRAAEIGITVDTTSLGPIPAEGPNASFADEWILAALRAVSTEAHESLENYRYDDAANAIYRFFWGSFCDYYIEVSKTQLDFSATADKVKTEASLRTLVSVFEAALRLLSPFMPFITEELWHEVHSGNPPKKSVALSIFPTPGRNPGDEEIIKLMQELQWLSSGILACRKECGVPEKLKVPVKVVQWAGAFGSSQRLENHPDILAIFARASSLDFVSYADRDTGGRYESLAWFEFGPTDIGFDYKAPERTIDVPAERARLTKDIAKYEKGVTAAERQLGNEAFLSKAPAQVVEGLKKQAAETRQLLEKARAALDALPPE
jgi:valyl-tRNA synthetase